MSTAPQLPPPPPLSSPSTVRLQLARQSRYGRTARRIDGAWWPRSYDLTAELPILLGELSRIWGRINSVLVSGATWPAPPGRILVAGQVVHVRRTDSPRALDTVCLLASGRGRWDLLVVPPAATEAEAGRLMDGAAGHVA
ncbi:DUF5994 family protein [Streptomyces sp. NPDC005202]|uniref:DUF5994 family protein n=1 Tax=Streptomyces sp. NPDC005202 TaxID=3157021 RepID=UPI0033BB4AB5